MATVKKTTRERGHLTPKQAEALQKKLRSAIAAASYKIDHGLVSPGQVVYLKKYIKKLQEANEYFSWNVATHAYDNPKKTIKKH